MVADDQNLQPLYLADVMTGLFAALAKTGHKMISTRNNCFDRAFARLYDDIAKAAPSQNLLPRFRISIHPAHGESQDVQQELIAAAGRDVISFQNPEYVDIQIKLSTEEAELLLETIPGGPRLFNHLSQRFLEHYNQCR